MGHNAPSRERWPDTAWPKVAPTVGDMIEQCWKVFTRCQKCGLVMQTPLELIVKVSGRKFMLWGERRVCRRYRCGGQVHFESHIPGKMGIYRLDETKITPLSRVMPKGWQPEDAIQEKP